MKTAGNEVWLASRTLSVASERRNWRERVAACDEHRRPDQAQRRSGRLIELLPERRCAWSGLLIVMMLFVAGCGSSEPAPVSSERPAKKQNAKNSGPGGTSAEQPQPAPVLPTETVAESIAESTEPQPQAQFRPTFPRRELTDEQLQQAGLVQHSARAVRLVTDLATDDANALLQAGAAIAEFWPQRFGELLPAEDRREFGFTAYVMRDREVFAEAGLLPEALPLLFHGRQEGSEFWMNDQTRDYYRRHLFLHEATHVFMRHIGGEADNLPLWFLEGMAELAATHHVSGDGEFAFNVFPDVRERFGGLDRIELLRRDVAENGVRSITEVAQLTAEGFARQESYAWSWALCVFLDSHPATRDEFRACVRNLREQSLSELLADIVSRDSVGIELDWTLFAAHVSYSYDFDRTAVKRSEGEELAAPRTVEVLSDRGWQSTGVRVESGQRLLVEAAGQFVLADQPKPWISEANGISFQFVGGLPIGRLLATVLVDDGSANVRAASMLEEAPLGNRAEFVAPVSGTLYLRINDDWGRLADNHGTLRVMVQATQ